MIHVHASYLDAVLDFTSIVADDEGWLHDSGELDVAVSFMLMLELVQQGLIGSLGEAGEIGNYSGTGSKSKAWQHLKSKSKVNKICTAYISGKELLVSLQEGKQFILKSTIYYHTQPAILESLSFSNSILLLLTDSNSTTSRCFYQSY